MKIDNVVPLFKDTKASSTAVTNLEGVIRDIKSGDVASYCIAIAKKDGTVETGWANCNIVERQNLVSNMQIDIMWSVVQANLTDE